MLGLGDSAVAEQLDRCLSGDAEPDHPAIRGMVTAAAALAPRRPVSEGARGRAFAAMMREADRRARPLAAEHSEDLADPGMHARVAQVGPGMQMRVADIEEIDDVRLEQIAAKLADRMRRSAPDRNQ
ncbi:hypothetical protein ACFC07_22145 [Streptomyces sp. NPDC056099]|uniref:hypothetical protein n=1 Tax=unclassified Streptomyces TaxID=2593676 RepID=UPI0035DB57DF